MSFSNLADFIQNKMRMSHIYQPVMLMTLLKNGGECHETVIARDILAHDQSQIEYYTHITNNMVGRVLRSHHLVTRDRVTKNYVLVGFQELSSDQIEHLIYLCTQRLELFLESRGGKVFEHRRKSSGYISGSIKYEVLKRAGFHCELCGISADQKALEVDHIIPRNLGGIDDISNFQALCYSCNAMKRDLDSTDFHKLRESFNFRDPGCLFCGMDSASTLTSNGLAYAIHDRFPVVELHTLIIPFRHIQSYFDLTQSEINACTQLLNLVKEDIKSQDPMVSGFNVGINDGASAGQTVFHCHIHLLPRRGGDVEDARGGIRHTIPGKGFY